MLDSTYSDSVSSLNMHNILNFVHEEGRVTAMQIVLFIRLGGRTKSCWGGMVRARKRFCYCQRERGESEKADGASLRHLLGQMSVFMFLQGVLSFTFN